MHLHASNWQHKFYFQHYTTPRDVPKQHSINLYLIPPLVLHLPCYLPSSFPPLSALYGVKAHHYVLEDLLLVQVQKAYRNKHICMPLLFWVEKRKSRELPRLPRAHLRCIHIFGCKSVYKKTRSTSQKLTLKPVNKPLTKFTEVTEGTVSGGT